MRNIFRQHKIVGHDRHHVQHVGHLSHVPRVWNLHVSLCNPYRQGSVYKPTNKRIPFLFFVLKFANEKRIPFLFFVLKYANEKQKSVRFSFSKVK